MPTTRDYTDYINDQVDIAPTNSQEELQAAELIEGLFVQHGLETQIQEFDAHTFSGVSSRVYLILLFIGVLLSGFLGTPVSYVGLAMVAISFVLIALSRFGHDPLASIGPMARSQNVIGVHRASGPNVIKGNRPIVIIAHYDTPRENFLNREPLVQWQPLVKRLSWPLSITVFVLGVVQAISFIPAMALHVFWVLGVLLALPLLVLGAASVYERFANCTTGANDNKASVAAMLGVLDMVRPAHDDAKEWALTHPKGVRHVIDEPAEDEYYDEDDVDLDEIDREMLGEEPAQTDGQDDAAAQEGDEPEGRDYQEAPRAAAVQREPVVDEYGLRSPSTMRRGASVLEALEILPPSCEIVYENLIPREEAIEIIELRNAANAAGGTFDRFRGAAGGLGESLGTGLESAREGTFNFFKRIRDFAQGVMSKIRREQELPEIEKGDVEVYPTVEYADENDVYDATDADDYEDVAFDKRAARGSVVRNSFDEDEYDEDDFEDDDYEDSYEEDTYEDDEYDDPYDDEYDDDDYYEEDGPVVVRRTQEKEDLDATSSSMPTLTDMQVPEVYRVETDTYPTSDASGAVNADMRYRRPVTFEVEQEPTDSPEPSAADTNPFAPFDEQLVDQRDEYDDPLGLTGRMPRIDTVAPNTVDPNTDIYVTPEANATTEDHAADAQAPTSAEVHEPMVVKDKESADEPDEDVLLWKPAVIADVEQQRVAEQWQTEEQPAAEEPVAEQQTVTESEPEVAQEPAVQKTEVAEEPYEPFGAWEEEAATTQENVDTAPSAEQVSVAGAEPEPVSGTGVLSALASENASFAKTLQEETYSQAVHQQEVTNPRATRQQEVLADELYGERVASAAREERAKESDYLDFEENPWKHVSLAYPDAEYEIIDEFTTAEQVPVELVDVASAGNDDYWSQPEYNDAKYQSVYEAVEEEPFEPEPYETQDAVDIAEFAAVEEFAAAAEYAAAEEYVAAAEYAATAEIAEAEEVVAAAEIAEAVEAYEAAQIVEAVEEAVAVKEYLEPYMTGADYEQAEVNDPYELVESIEMSEPVATPEPTVVVITTIEDSEEPDEPELTEEVSEKPEETDEAADETEAEEAVELASVTEVEEAAETEGVADTDEAAEVVVIVDTEAPIEAEESVEVEVAFVAEAPVEIEETVKPEETSEPDEAAEVQESAEPEETSEDEGVSEVKEEAAKEPEQVHVIEIPSRPVYTPSYIDEIDDPEESELETTLTFKALTQEQIEADREKSAATTPVERESIEVVVPPVDEIDASAKEEDSAKVEDSLNVEDSPADEPEFVADVPESAADETQPAADVSEPTADETRPAADVSEPATDEPEPAAEPVPVVAPAPEPDPSEIIHQMFASAPRQKRYKAPSTTDVLHEMFTTMPNIERMPVEEQRPAAEEDASEVDVASAAKEVKVAQDAAQDKGTADDATKFWFDKKPEADERQKADPEPVKDSAAKADESQAKAQAVEVDSLEEESRRIMSSLTFSVEQDVSDEELDEKDITGLTTMSVENEADVEDSMPMVQERIPKPRSVDDPNWGKSSFKPSVMSAGRRAMLLDLPDPSVMAVDPLKSNRRGEFDDAAPAAIDEEAARRLDVLRRVPSPLDRPVAPEKPERQEEEPQKDEPEARQESASQPKQSVPERKSLRDRLSSFSFRQETEGGQQESMSDWLGLEDDYDAKKDGRQIGTWDNFDDEKGKWKGGATLRSGLRDYDMDEEGIEEEPASKPYMGLPNFDSLDLVPNEDDFDAEDLEEVISEEELIDEILAEETMEELREAVLQLGDYDLIAHDIWFVGVGASSLNHAGIKAFLDEHRRDIRGAFLVNLDSIGAGDLTILTSEGMGKKRRGDRRMARMLNSIADKLHINLNRADYSWDETDATPAMQRSVRVATLMGMSEDGVPAYSHTADDEPEYLNDRQISDVATLIAQLIRES